MFTLIWLAVLLIVGIALRVVGAMKRVPEGAMSIQVDNIQRQKAWFRYGSYGVFGVMVLSLGFSMVTFVPDGHVAVTRAFGEYGSTLSPGPQVIMPWESTEEIDTRIKSYTFSGEEGESVSGPIRVQASSGGNLTLELTVQLLVQKDTADDLLREVGDDWFEIVVKPQVRSCTRDATTSLTLEEAYTTQRSVIAENITACVRPKVERFHVTLEDVLIRDVDPGEAVRTAIDEKQKAEQDLQRASIALQEEEVKAQQEAVKAFGISNAEQIVACGGTESEGEDGQTVIIPNLECEEQFSEEYLQWLYINQLSEVDGVVILPPEFNGELFVQTPQPPARTADGE